MPDRIYPNWGESLGGGIERGFESIMGGLERGRRRDRKDAELDRNDQLLADRRKRQDNLLAEQRSRQDAQSRAQYGMSSGEMNQAHELQQQFGGLDPMLQQETLTQEESGLMKEWNQLQKMRIGTQEANIADSARRAAGGGPVQKSNIVDAGGIPRLGTFNPNAPEGERYKISPGGLRPATGLTGVVSNDDIEQASQDVASGKIAPQQIAKILGRGGASTRLRIHNRAKQINPDYNPRNAALEFNIAKSALGGEARTLGTATGRIEGAERTLNDLLIEIEPLIAATSIGKIRIANEAYQKGLESISDEEANELLTLLNEATGLYAFILKGTGASATEREFDEASKRFSAGLSPTGFAGVSRGIRKAASSRVRRLRQGIGEVTQRASEGGRADVGGGLTPDEQAELDILEKKYGGR